jgi:isopenicillin N synthase-like dioxygenase
VEQLRHACHTVGFFVVQIRRPNELVSTSREVLHATREFFQNHPLEEKMTIAYDRSPQFRGYMRLGVENTDGKIDYREQIEYATEYDTNTTTTTKDPEPYEECLKGINLWPTRVQPSLQPIVESYVAQIQTTARSLQQALIMAMMLGSSSSSSHPSHREIKKRIIMDRVNHQWFRHPHWAIKLIHYPPLPTASPSSLVTRKMRMGVGEHVDTNFLTLILQDDDNPGLQMYSRNPWSDPEDDNEEEDGVWIDVPNPSWNMVENDDDEIKDDWVYLIGNLGEQAEIMSRGYFLATPHRVIIPSNHNDNPTTTSSQLPSAQPGRISIAFFYNPSLETIVEPLSSPDEQMEQFVWERRPLPRWTHGRRSCSSSSSSGENPMLACVGENTLKSLARSHPTVMAQHHPHLQVLSDGRVIRKTEIQEPQPETIQDHVNIEE